MNDTPHTDHLPARTSDAYDEQIDRLIANPDLITFEWINAIGIFAFLPNSSVCLTMLRKPFSNSIVAIDPAYQAIAREISADELVPSLGSAIRLTHLPRMADYRRRIDAISVA